MSKYKILYGRVPVAEPSMRRELEIIYDEENRGEIGIFRRLIRDSNNQTIECPKCRHIGTHGHASWHLCDRCLGTGYLWTEEGIKFYKWPGTTVARSRRAFKEYRDEGFIETNLHVVYVEYHVLPNIDDKIIQLRQDTEGNPVIVNGQYERFRMWDIRAIDEYRLDGGKIEYWRLATTPNTVGNQGQPLATRNPGPGRILP